MKTTTLLSTLASLSLASARITGFATPSTVAPDSTVKLLILTENFSQTVEDVAVSFGITPTNVSYPGALGTVLSNKYLGPGEFVKKSSIYMDGWMYTDVAREDLSNIVENITHYVHIPATFQKGEATLTAAHFSLIGAMRSGITTSYNVNITVGDNTSSDYVRSTLVPDQSS